MVKGKVAEPRVAIERPDINYRKLDALNQSMIKLFDENPFKFFEEFKMGKKRKEKKNPSLIIGDIVDFFVLACRGDEECFHNRLEERFALMKGTKGGGQAFVLADLLYDETEPNINDEGKITVCFETRFTDAFNKIKAITDKDGNPKYYKGKTEAQALEDFNKNAYDYFKTKMDNVGKVVVDQSIIDKSLFVAKNLLRDEFTRDIFKGNDDLEYLTHYPIEWTYVVDDKRSILCKSEIDGLLIDHDNKLIQPFDLKTTFDNESFEYMYIKNSYYLQLGFYMMALIAWKDGNGMADYKINPMRFVVADTSVNNRRPLVYVTSKEDIQKGLDGFTMRGAKYRGVRELVDAIAWAESTGNWVISREAFENNGQVKLNIQYDK